MLVTGDGDSLPALAKKMELKIFKFEARLGPRPNLSLAVENPAIAWHQNSRQPESGRCKG